MGLVMFPNSYGEMQYNTIYGSHNMKNLDCPFSSNGKCGCKDRLGVVLPTFKNPGTKMIKTSKIRKILMKGGNWGGSS